MVTLELGDPGGYLPGRVSVEPVAHQNHLSAWTPYSLVRGPGISLELCTLARAGYIRTGSPTRFQGSDQGGSVGGPTRTKYVEAPGTQQSL